jgi:hypothetical protein
VHAGTRWLIQFSKSQAVIARSEATKQSILPLRGKMDFLASHYSFAVVLLCGGPLRAPIGKSATACDLEPRVMLASQYRTVIPCRYG